MAAAAAGRRTESAFAGFATAHGFDVLVNAGKPEPRIAKLPGVTSATELVFAVNGQPTCDCTHPINGNDLYVGVVPTPEEPPASRRLGGNPYRLNVGYPCWAVRDATRETLVVQTGGAASTNCRGSSGGPTRIDLTVTSRHVRWLRAGPEPSPESPGRWVA